MAAIAKIKPTLDTNAFADGDVLFNPVAVAGVVQQGSQPLLLQSLSVVDLSDQGTAFDLVFFDTAGVSLGTVNAAASISDADLAKCVARVSVGTSDYYDFGGARFADVGSIGKLIAAGEGLWVGAIARGAPTYAADALTIRIGFVQ